MKRLVPCLLLLAGCSEEVKVRPAGSELAPGEAFPHALWTEFLAKHSRDGFVDYAAVKADPAALDAYLGWVAKYSPESHPALFPTREHRLAYALNAYNAYVVRGVVDHYPVASVRDIGVTPFSFFKTLEFPFGGRRSSLEAWETGIRETFGDPRIHFALNCASLGCPRLPAEAFVPERLEEQLARETRAFLASPANVAVDDGTLRLSAIFKWYRKDFEGWQEAQGRERSLAAWIRGAGRDVPDGEIAFVEYDWSLNDRK